MSQRVGIVGMGLMGQAFIKNMRETGFEVQGFDVEPKRMDDLREKGGHPVETPAAAASGVNFVITSLPTSDVAREATFGPGGVAEGAKEGLYLLDTTTSRPEDSVRLAEDLAGRGVRFLDSAVSGTSTMAVEKDLVVIAGGEAEDFDACRAVFAGFSRAAYHMGPVGSGARTKLVINMILAGNRLALAEGLMLGTKVGLEMDNLLEVLKDGACFLQDDDRQGPQDDSRGLLEAGPGEDLAQGFAPHAGAGPPPRLAHAVHEHLVAGPADGLRAGLRGRGHRRLLRGAARAGGPAVEDCQSRLRREGLR